MKMMMALSVAIFGMSACASWMQGTPEPAHQRAVHDLSCPKAQIEVTHLSGTTYVAKGCGQIATYMCSGSNFMTDGTCMLEGTKPAG